MELSAKLGARSATLALQVDATIGDLHDAIRGGFDLSADSELRILAKGKLLSADKSAFLAELTLRSGAKLMVMETRAADRVAVEEARPERMRGFEDDDRRQRTGGLASGRPVSAAYRSRNVGPTFKFHGTTALINIPDGAKPPVAAAQAMLRELSTDPAILAIMAEHKWNVGMLREMPPEGLVGVSASCLMGLNQNKGEEILLRLRTDDWQGLRPYASVIPVLLHELTHNVFSDHNHDFKTLNSQLNREYQMHLDKARGGRATGSRLVAPAREEPQVTSDEGHILGGRSAAGTAQATASQAAARAAAARTGLIVDTRCACGACIECAECDAPDTATEG